MKYNKTKRGLEMAAGIVGVIYSVVSLFYLFYVIIIMGAWINYNSSYESLYIIIVIIFLGICIFSLIFNSILISSPFRNGKVARSNGIRVGAMIIAGLTCNFITLGLMIAVVCLKDFVDENSKIEQNTGVVQEGIKRPDTIDGKVADLKRFKELGIIGDEQYEKAIKKIIEDLK